MKIYKEQDVCIYSCAIFFLFVLVQDHLYLMKATTPRFFSNTTARYPHKFLHRLNLHLSISSSCIPTLTHLLVSAPPTCPWLWWESSKRLPQLWPARIDRLSTPLLPLAIGYLPPPGKWRPRCFLCRLQPVSTARLGALFISVNICSPKPLYSNSSERRPLLYLLFSSFSSLLSSLLEVELLFLCVYKSNKRAL